MRGKRLAVFASALLVGSLVMLLMGCERDIDGRTSTMRENDERLSILDANRAYDEKKASGENCLKRNGIIVRSSWDGRIVDCK